MPTDAETIRSLDLFSELNDIELETVAALFHPMRVNEGETLIRRGETAHTFFIVLEGNFMISFKEGRAITLHQKGDVMGWSSVVTPFRYTGTAVALTDGGVLTMTGDEFSRLIQSDAALGDKIMNKLNPIIAERVPYFSRSERSQAAAAAESEDA
jgi:CRP-like cAMP-binding protein